MALLGKFVVVMLGVVSFGVYAKDMRHNENLEKCDYIVVGSLNDVYQQIECYLSVGDNLIENYYGVNSEYVKQKWKNYVQAVVDMNFELKNSRNECVSGCGVYEQIDASVIAAMEVRKMLERILDEHKKL